MFTLWDNSTLGANMSAFSATFKPSWACLGAVLEPFCTIWDHLGHLWDRLGGYLGLASWCSWAILGLSGAILGPSWFIWSLLGDLFESSIVAECPLGYISCSLGTILATCGAIFGNLWGHLVGYLGRSWGSKGHFPPKTLGFS